MTLTKSVTYKSCYLNFVFFSEKNLEGFSWFLTKKVDFENPKSEFTADFQSGVDVPKIFSNKKVLFTTQLSYDLMQKLL